MSSLPSRSAHSSTTGSRAQTPAFAMSTVTTDRDGWWRSSMRMSPNPGTYRSSSFTDGMPPCSSIFRACSREKQYVPKDQPEGEYALPGLYDIKGHMQEFLKQPKTYNFRNTSRDAWGVHLVGQQDKEIDVAPGQYGDRILPKKEAYIRSANFLDSSPRFPTPPEHSHTFTRYVAPSNPPPTKYVPKSFLARERPASSITSTMGSHTERFSPPKAALGPRLGPGCYTKPTVPLRRTPRPPPRAASAPPPDTTTTPSAATVL